MFDGIMVGSTAPGGGSTPTLQQVTDASGSPATTTGNIFANRLSVNDEANAQEVVIKANDYEIQFQESGAGFGFEYSNSAGTQLTVKNNDGAILTDVSIRKLSILGISSTTPTNCTIPHPYGIVPDMVLVVAKNILAANFLGATTGGGIGGYQVHWDDTDVNIDISTPSPNDTDVMDFDLLFYFIPV